MLQHCICHGTVWSNVQCVFKQWNCSFANSKKVNDFVTRFISFYLSSVIQSYHESRYSFIWSKEIL